MKSKNRSKSDSRTNSWGLPSGETDRGIGGGERRWRRAPLGQRERS